MSYHSVEVHLFISDVTLVVEWRCASLWTGVNWDFVVILQLHCCCDCFSALFHTTSYLSSFFSPIPRAYQYHPSHTRWSCLSRISSNRFSITFLFCSENINGFCWVSTGIPLTVWALHLPLASRPDSSFFGDFLIQFGPSGGAALLTNNSINKSVHCNVYSILDWVYREINQWVIDRHGCCKTTRKNWIERSLKGGTVEINSLLIFLSP